MLNHTLLSCRVQSPSNFCSLAIVIASSCAICLAGCTALAPTPAQTPNDTPCSVADASPVAVVLVTATSAEPAPSLPTGARATLTALADADDACVAVQVGAHPLTVLPLTPFRRNGKPEHGSQRSALVGKNLDRLGDVVRSSAETVDGLDLVGAIRTASRRAPSARTLIVVSSGLSTRDPLDLRRLGWALDPEPIVGRLRAARELADLTGWRVTLAGLGQAAGHQPALTPALAQRLQDLWTALCRAFAAASCAVDPALLDQPATATDAVPIVPLPAVTRTPTGFTLPGALLFGLDDATLTAAARDALAQVAAVAATDPRQLAVIGHADASTGGAAHNRQLSGQRARAVAAALEALGVLAQRIPVIRGDGAAGFSAADELAHPEHVSKHRSVEVQFIEP